MEIYALEGVVGKKSGTLVQKMVEEIVLRCAMAREFLYRPGWANALMEKYGSAEEIFRNAGEIKLQEEGPSLHRAFSGEMLEWAAQEVEWCTGKGVELIFYGEKRYPQMLMGIPDAPYMLYFKGNADPNAERGVAMVGTRLASSYGKEMCSRIVEHLADYNPVIFSGLAYGIDIASHKAALEGGLQTIAVLPNGIDMIYPSRHRDVAAQMVQQGGILTEFPRGEQPLRLNFIKRNRIIAAISQALVVVESRVKGGAMITAEYASNYNKDIFAVPGRVTDTNSFGCNYLIAKNVAAIYNSPSVIPTTLGWERNYTPDSQFQLELFSSEISHKEKILLSLKFDKPAAIETLCARTGFDWETVSVLLLELELEGKITVKNNTDYYLRR